jgi:signal transduction histidine kinase
VSDDGQGFDVPSSLLDMRERLELLGGELEIISQTG